MFAYFLYISLAYFCNNLKIFPSVRQNYVILLTRNHLGIVCRTVYSPIFTCFNREPRLFNADYYVIIITPCCYRLYRD